MRSRKFNIPGHRELLEALALDGKRTEDGMIERIDHMLEDDLFNLDSIRSLARESVMHVPIETSSEEEFHLVIKCNERLEMLVDRVKHEISMFIENAEKIRGLIDLNILDNHGIDSELQSTAWKNELVQMQGQLSSYQMDILTYYRHRSDIGTNILKRSWRSDCLTELIGNDEDLFFKLRMMLTHLRSFQQIVSHWIH